MSKRLVQSAAGTSFLIARHPGLPLPDHHDLPNFGFQPDIPNLGCQPDLPNLGFQPDNTNIGFQLEPDLPNCNLGFWQPENTNLGFQSQPDLPHFGFQPDLPNPGLPSNPGAELPRNSNPLPNTHQATAPHNKAYKPSFRNGVSTRPNLDLLTAPNLPSTSKLPAGPTSTTTSAGAYNLQTTSNLQTLPTTAFPFNLWPRKEDGEGWGGKSERGGEGWAKKGGEEWHPPNLLPPAKHSNALRDDNYNAIRDENYNTILDENYNTLRDDHIDNLRDDNVDPLIDTSKSIPNPTRLTKIKKSPSGVFLPQKRPKRLLTVNVRVLKKSITTSTFSGAFNVIDADLLPKDQEIICPVLTGSTGLDKASGSENLGSGLDTTYTGLDISSGFISSGFADLGSSLDTTRSTGLDISSGYISSGLDDLGSGLDVRCGLEDLGSGLDGSSDLDRSSGLNNLGSGLDTRSTGLDISSGFISSGLDDLGSGLDGSSGLDIFSGFDSAPITDTVVAPTAAAPTAAAPINIATAAVPTAAAPTATTTAATAAAPTVAATIVVATIASMIHDKTPKDAPKKPKPTPARSFFCKVRQIFNCEHNRHTSMHPYVRISFNLICVLS